MSVIESKGIKWRRLPSYDTEARADVHIGRHEYCKPIYFLRCTILEKQSSLCVWHIRFSDELVPNSWDRKGHHFFRGCLEKNAVFLLQFPCNGAVHQFLDTPTLNFRNRKHIIFLLFSLQRKLLSIYRFLLWHAVWAKRTTAQVVENPVPNFRKLRKHDFFRVVCPAGTYLLLYLRLIVWAKKVGRRKRFWLLYSKIRDLKNVNRPGVPKHLK